MRIGMNGECMGFLCCIGLQVSHSTLDKRYEDENY
jgi:hypothetical protein